MALGAAFSFVIMMFNVPVIGGSTGHAVGATLIAIVLGPWAAVIAISIALVIQALAVRRRRHHRHRRQLLQHGGRPAVRRLLPLPPGRRRRAVGARRRVVSAGVAAYVAIVAAAIFAGFEFGIQPYIAHTASGQALYAPYPLGVAVPAMALEHLLFFGWVEAIVTMGVVAALARSEPRCWQMKPAAKPLRWLWAGIGVLILLAPWARWRPARRGANGAATSSSRWSATCPPTSRSWARCGRRPCPTT